MAGTHIAEPRTDTTTSPLEARGIVVILSDAFGWQFPNSRILADELARKGNFRVYLPDFFDGHTASLGLLDSMPKLTATGFAATLMKPYYGLQAAAALGPFLIANRPGISMPKIVPWFEAIREDANQEGLRVGVAGYCWGGKPAACLAHTELVDCAFLAHPSNLALPDEIEKIRAPVSIAIGDKDIVMGLKQIDETRFILDKNQTSKNLKSEMTVYPGAKHGFAVRGDPNDEQEKKHSIEAEDQAVKWFQTHLVVA